MYKRRKRSIFDIIREYMEDFETMVEEWMGYAAAERPSWDVRSGCLEPLRNVFVTADEVVITVDLPYTEPESVEVEAISDDLIEVKAKIKRRLRFDDFGMAHREGEFSSFRCRTRIPVPVETERMKILFKRGILEVHLPRKRGYRIPVE